MSLFKRESEKIFIRVPTLYPMGAITFAIACSVCKNKGKEFCKECKSEIKSHFELETNNTVFLTKEEAEAKLKERENNA